MADIRVKNREELEGPEQSKAKRQCLEPLKPIMEEEDEFEEGWGDTSENWITVSKLKNRYKDDPEVDEKVKELLDQHLDQAHKSLGFEINVDINPHLPRKYRWVYPVNSDDPEFEKVMNNIHKSMEAALEEYKKRKEKVLERVRFVKATKLNNYEYLGHLYFITFEAKNKEGKTKTYQTRVNYQDFHKHYDDLDDDDSDDDYIYKYDDMDEVDNFDIDVQFFRQKPSS